MPSEVGVREVVMAVQKSLLFVPASFNLHSHAFDQLWFSKEPLFQPTVPIGSSMVSIPQPLNCLALIIGPALPAYSEDFIRDLVHVVLPLHLQLKRGRSWICADCSILQTID